jgi:hypothetical protein
MGFRSLFSSWIYPPEVVLGEQFNFGNREILVAANNLAADTFFMGLLQHGWYSSQALRPVPTVRKKDFSIYPIFTWSERQRNLLLELGYPRVHTIGSPWAHLLQACHIDPENSKGPVRKDSSNLSQGKKLLFFPNHSVPGSQISHSANLNLLREISDCNSITVCLFWLDFVDPSIRKYYEAFGCDLQCVGYRGSAGGESPWSPTGGRLTFLPNLLDLMISHDLVAVEETTTTFWYAASLKKPIIIVPPSGDFTWWGNSTKSPESYKKIEHSSFLGEVSTDLESLATLEIIEVTNELLNFALSELGWFETHSLQIMSLEKQLISSLPLASELIVPARDYISNFELQR